MIAHIGFTGTRNGMTDEQRKSVDMLIAEIIGGNIDLRVHAHHGDCIGADEKFHELAQQYGCKTIGHPSTHRLRAFCRFDYEHDRKDPLSRNADIVGFANVMLATPAEADEQERGGTWATIRMARKAQRPLAIVKPDGEVVRERWPESWPWWSTEVAP